MDVMPQGVWLTLQAALRVKTARAGRSLIPIGSSLVFASLPKFIPHLASKHRVIGLVRGMTIDRASGIMVDRGDAAR